MKTHLLLLPLLVTAPVTALAQANTSSQAAPRVSIDPAGRALLDEATARYAAASGVRFDVSYNQGQTSIQSRVSFQKPNLLRVENTLSTRYDPTKACTFTLSDGRILYHVKDKTFERQGLPTKKDQLWTVSLNNVTGFLMPVMLAGRSPLAAMEDLLKKAPFYNPRMILASTSETLVEGELLRGVKINLSFDAPSNHSPAPSTEIYFWFGADHLLRRVQMRDMSSGHDVLSREIISAQTLSPAFAPDTFQFNATGLRPTASQTENPDEQIYWDKRLQVGTQPFAFSTKSLDGQTISPANFKGKVLLLDFWATWCGPCVASLPDLQAAYKKYHAQGLEVVGISLDHDQSDLTSFIAARKMAWPQVFDSKAQGVRVSKIYGVQAIPFFLVIGRDGKIAAVNPRDDLDGAVKRALAAK